MYLSLITPSAESALRYARYMAVYLFHGTDRFARQEAVAALRREHDADGSLANNSIEFEGARLSLAELSVAASAVPFLGATRWVRVNGLCARFSGGGRGARSLGDWSDLDELLPNLPPSTALVFVEDDLRRGNPMQRLIEPHADVRAFSPLKAEAATEWLRSAVRSRGLHLTRNAARALVERSGGDRGAMTQAIEKLSLYAGDANVDDAIVEAMIPQVRSVTIFNLIDAVAEQRISDAMQLLDAVRADGTAEQVILQMLARTYRQIIIARDVLDRGGSQADIQSAIKSNFSWLAGRLRRQAQRYSQASADATLERILEAETAIIDYRQGQGGLQEDIAVELLIADLAGSSLR